MAPVALKALARGLGMGRSAWLLPLDVTFRTFGLRYGWMKGLFDHAPAGPLAMTGRLRAERAAWRASQRVPGYRAYLIEHGGDPGKASGDRQAQLHRPVLTGGAVPGRQDPICRDDDR
jgi:hypothetical protein